MEEEGGGGYSVVVMSVVRYLLVHSSVVSCRRSVEVDPSAHSSPLMYTAHIPAWARGTLMSVIVW